MALPLRESFFAVCTSLFKKQMRFMHALHKAESQHPDLGTLPEFCGLKKHFAPKERAIMRFLNGYPKISHILHILFGLIQ